MMKRRSPQTQKIIKDALYRIEQLQAELENPPDKCADESHAIEWARKLLPEGLKDIVERADVREITRQRWHELTRNRLLIRLITAEMRALEQSRTIADAEQAARFGESNLRRKKEAETEHQKWHEIASKLLEQRPELRRASREKWAREVQSALAQRGTQKSVKQIRRALFPKK
jgi:hypothetical protein